MSLVGPRAYYPDELREQQRNYPKTEKSVKIVLSVKRAYRILAVSGRSEVNFDKRIDMDASYVEEDLSFTICEIILKTPWAMISAKAPSKGDKT